MKLQAHQTEGWPGLLLLCMAAMLLFTPARADDTGLPALIGAEEIQNAVSAKLVKMKEAQRDRQRPSLERTIDDIQRVSHLPEDRLRMLRIAGQGMLEHAADENNRSLVAEVESRVKGVSPKLVAKVLAGIDDSSSSMGRAIELPGWREALQQLLTAEERKHWEQVVADRQAYRVHAIAELGLMQVQPFLGLDEEQTRGLRPLLEKAVRDYLPDLMGMFGEDNEDRGLFSGWVTVFILGVAEEDAHAIVKPEQWSKWQAAAGEGAGSWSWIKQSHYSRVKKGKP